ncbi:1716_t:CDS:2 [Entrophospora sp. SA101]|nr:14481_t:CDS:2 [Entrophospora sp. SA101]CAJ0862867.1 1716_t:CDS:2 [Entrophospora sp. SA101]
MIDNQFAIRFETCLLGKVKESTSLVASSSSALSSPKTILKPIPKLVDQSAATTNTTIIINPDNGKDATNNFTGRSIERLSLSPKPHILALLVAG